VAAEGGPALTAGAARRSREAARRHLSTAAEEAIWKLELLAGEHAQLLLLLDRMAVLRHVADLVRETVGSDLAAVAPREDDGLVVIRFLSGARGGSLQQLNVRRGLGLGGRVFASAVPATVDDYTAARSITHDFDTPVRAEGLHALAAVPIVSGDSVAAIVYAGTRDEGSRFGDSAVDSMIEIASRAGVALDVQHSAAATAEARVSDERHRIAVRLHDSVGAQLFGIGAEVRDLRLTAGADPDMAARLAVLEKRLVEASATLRAAVESLGESPGGDALADAVEGDCHAFEGRTGVSARTIVLGVVPSVDAARRQVLQRVVREALLNVEKHAHAGSVVVTIAGVGDGVSVAVSDDGAGFTPDPDHRGVGLVSLQESVAQVGGTMSVVCDEDGGTTVRAWVPQL
jgi:signal transduction histidine kinase